MYNKHDNARSLLILIITLTSVRILLASAAPLLPQEAYYWTWSQYPALSYFDHPPLASYSIAITTTLFGDTSFGIKLAAVLWSLGCSILCVRMVIDMFDDRKLAFWSLLIIHLTVFYVLSTIVITPDAPLLFGWMGTVWALWRVRQTGHGRWWWLAGLFLGIALLSKYAAILLIGVAGMYMLIDPPMRRWLLRPEPYLAVVLAMVIFSPVLLWNMQHDWVSTTFQSTRRIGQMREIHPRFFAVMVLSQTLLLTPYPMWQSVAAIWRTWTAQFSGKASSAQLLLVLSASIPLLVFTLASFGDSVKIQWLIPAWWSLIILGMHHVLSRSGTGRAFKIGLASTAILLAVSLTVFMLPNLPVGAVNTWSGWREAAVRVDALVQAKRQQGQQVFVFSPNYRISSLIWFHRPSQERTHAQNIFGMRALHYDYFPSDGNLQGQTGIFVITDRLRQRTPMEDISAMFESMERVEVVDTQNWGRSVRKVEIWVGYNYKGLPLTRATSAEPESP
jgi:4-amino-4-deoxy-L-arabinose transferase-like glycosyltransferase